MNERACDVAVVGGGIVGLACAIEARRRGLSVVLFERQPAAIGASIRNFGMIWPIGQLPGPGLNRAKRARARWVELAASAGFMALPVGSMHAVHHEDEVATLEEFVGPAGGQGFEVEMLTPEQATARSPWLVRQGLRAAMFSRTEIQVDPQQAIRQLTEYARAHLSVEIRTGIVVRGIHPPYVELSSGERWKAERACVCTGEDTRLLYPEVYAGSGLTPCKLQMMRTGPQVVNGAVSRLGPMLAFGSTLRHYRSFENCPSLAKVRARFAAERPEFDRWGIHVMASQMVNGEVTLGDSHEYGEPVLPFLREHIDTMILDYLRERLAVPDLSVAERWFGVYPKSTTGATEFVASPDAAVRVVNGVGGAGMTLSFGLAEEVFDAWGA